MKIYTCPNRENFLTGITAKTGRIFIDFEPKTLGLKRIATYSTSDPNIIEALESDPRFGTIWVTLSDDIDSTETPTEKINDTIKIPADIVGGFQQARKYLITQFGYTATDVSNIEEVTKAAKSKNIEFLGWTPNKSTKTL